MIVLNYKKVRRVVALILVTPVAIGLTFVYQNSHRVKSYAVGDPLTVTYNGSTPPNPMFEIFNTLPGDEIEKTFNVKNDSSDPVNIIMTTQKTDEEKEFADILDVEIIELSLSGAVFSGKLQNLFDAPPIDLGTFPAGTDKNFKVKIKFPHEAGNEYQNAKVVFDIIWKTSFPPIEVPSECQHLAGGITRVVEGTDGNDIIIGTKESELFILKNGNDIVFAGKGNDIILGGDGNDSRLDGSDGNDCILGGKGNDNIDGSDDNDILYGNEGNDRIDGGSNNDIIYGGGGNDNIDGGHGNDQIYGEDGNDNVEGGSGNDEIHGGSGNDTLDGESGNDSLFGDEGNDTARGGSGDDFIDGGTDTDNLHGGTGTDTCVNAETKTSCEI